eukprot:5403155-Alexandrium_andersonii.AAC.1
MHSAVLFVQTSRRACWRRFPGGPGGKFPFGIIMMTIVIMVSLVIDTCVITISLVSAWQGGKSAWQGGKSAR